MGEYETSLQERERHDAEIAAENKARQVRLGHIPAPEEKSEKKTPEEKKEPSKTDGE
jgi:hypothetical protein